MSIGLEDMQAVMCLPPVPFAVQFAAQIPMNGMKIIPQDLWGKVAEFLQRSRAQEESNTKLINAGFTRHENHTRGEAHEYFHLQLGEENPGAWVIPVDELVGDDELISIERYLFQGTEKELREAIGKALSA